jgi:hypothetical protein
LNPILEIRNENLHQRKEETMNTIMGSIDLQCCVSDSWKGFIDGLEKSIQMLDEKITEAENMSSQVTGEWATAIEHVIDDLSNFVFSISEPRGTPEAYSQKIKELRKRIHDHYARFKAVKAIAKLAA